MSKLAATDLHFSFDGRPLIAPAGSTVAGALVRNGVSSWRRTRVKGHARGVFCGIGTCFDCLIDVNGERAVRACLRALCEGDRLETSSSTGAGPDA